jgi:hypothetical protein
MILKLEAGENTSKVMKAELQILWKHTKFQSSFSLLINFVSFVFPLLGILSRCIADPSCNKTNLTPNVTKL